MRYVRIFDTTLRDGEQAPGNSMHASEKSELSAQLEKLGVDIIEAGFAAASAGDFDSIKEIAEARKDCVVCSLARCKKADIDLAYEALKNAAVPPRIHVFIATSPIHMEYKLKLTPDEVLSAIAENVAYARKKVSDVQFSCEDATRSDMDFLIKAVSRAIENGATTINIPDTVGYSHPEEIEGIFTRLLNEVKGADKAVFAVHCHNDLGLAVANSLAAVKAGAGQVECTLNGIGERAGNAALEEIVMALKTRKDYYDADTRVVTKQIYSSSMLLSTITGVKIHPTKPIVGKNAFSHEAGIHQHGMLENKKTYEIMEPSAVGIIQNNLILGKHSGKHAFREYLTGMGIEVGDDDLNILFEKFKTVADRKKTVTHKDIEYLVSHTNSTRIKKKYSLENYGITTIKNGEALATITLLDADGSKKSENAAGDGPIDASFKAINAIIGKDFKLIDWSVNAITEGKDALGAATLRLSCDGVEAAGRGVSTDTVEASLLAYLNGINKLLDMVP